MHACIHILARALERLRVTQTALPLHRKLAIAALALPIFLLLGMILLWQRLRRAPIQTIGTTLEGAQFHCTLPDMIQTYLYLFGVWEPDLSAFIRLRMQPGDVFLDIGANIGYYTLLASRLAGENGGAVAVEASPTTFALLQANLALNNCPKNVRTMNVAAAAERGTLPVYRGPAFNTGITTTLQSKRLELECEVTALPIAELLEDAERERLKLVKIDIEGAEEHVLPTLADFLQTCPEHTEFLIELTPLWWQEKKGKLGEVLAPFLESGYHPYKVHNSYLPWRYLWPADVRPPTRIRGGVKAWMQIDLVLSRIDAPTL